MSNGPEGFAFPPLREPGTLGKTRRRVKPASGPSGIEPVLAVARPSRIGHIQGPSGGLFGWIDRVLARKASGFADADLAEIRRSRGSRGRSPSRRHEECPGDGLAVTARPRQASGVDPA